MWRRPPSFSGLGYPKNDQKLPGPEALNLGILKNVMDFRAIVGPHWC